MPSFWVCYYHLIWATSNREPVITASRERLIFEAIRSKSEELKSPVMALNGVEDHIHAAVCIHPSVSVSTWVAQTKGASSHAVNAGDSADPNRFRWQGGYGVLTFGKLTLADVVGYIARQKQHHKSGKLVPYLEQIDDDDAMQSESFRSSSDTFGID